MASGRAVVRATFMLGALTIASRIVGFVREQAIAWRFGAGGLVDSYVAALFVPQLLGGIIQVVLTPFMPVYIEQRETSAGRQVASTTFFAILGASLVGGASVVVLAPQLVRLFVGNFSADQQVLTVGLVRILAVSIMFGSGSAFLTMLFNGHQDFLVPALSAFGFNAVVVPAVLLIRGLSIQGLAWAATVGTLLPLALMIAVAGSRSYPLFASPMFGAPAFLRIVRLSGPLWFSSLAGQLYMIVDRRLASGLDVGSLAALNFANMLVQLPVGILVTTLVTALFPTLAEHAAKGDGKALAKVVAGSVRAMCMLMIPASVGLIVLRYPIVRLAFERGAFDGRATAETAVALGFYAVGLTGISVGQVLSRVFHAMQDTLTPVKIGMALLLGKIGLALALVGPLGHGGLALTVSLGATLSTALLMIVLARRMERGTFNLLPLVMKVALASILMGLVAHAALRVTAALGQLFSLGTAVACGLGVYGLMLLAFKVEEAHWACAVARQRSLAMWRLALKVK